MVQILNALPIAIAALVHSGARIHPHLAPSTDQDDVLDLAVVRRAWLRRRRRTGGSRINLNHLLLVTLMPLSAATAVVVVARFLAVLADLVVAGSAWAWGRRHHLLGSST